MEEDFQGYGSPGSKQSSTAEILEKIFVKQGFVPK